MAYLSLYRKWRPRTFEEVVGQEHITRTLRNSIRSGRVSHAYLFCGPRGTGKTTVAKLLAKALNCKKGPTPDPCDRCEPCTRIREGHSMDVVEIDGASNRGIDEVRDLRERVKLLPTEGKYKVYIIDEVHMLTTEAFNALLKTLEEPPGHVVFVFATTEPERILPTILSRCQRFDFRRLTSTEVMRRLKQVAQAEGINAEEEALHLIAKKGDGSLRDSLGLLEQCVAFEGETLTYGGAVSLLGVSQVEELLEFGRLVAARDVAGALEFVDRIIFSGKDPAQFLKDIAEHYRDLLVIRECQGKTELVDAADSWRPLLAEQAASYEAGDLIRILDLILACENAMRRSANPQITLEVLAVRLARPEAAEAVSVTDRTGQGSRGGGAQASPRDGAIVASASPASAGPSTDGRVLDTGGVSEISEVAAVASPEESCDLRPGTDSISSWWPKVTEEVKKAKRTVHTLLFLARPLGVQGDLLTLSSGKQWVAERLQERSNREVVEKAIVKVLGIPLRVKCEHTAEEDSEEKDAGGSTEDPDAGQGISAGTGGETPSREVIESPTDEEVQISDGLDSTEGEEVDTRELLERMRRIESEPIIKDVLSLFGGRVLKVE